MVLRLKSLKEPSSKEDGIRIMIARYPIRGQRREDRDWQWWKELAPSIQLHRDWYDNKLTWEQYTERYTNEINRNMKAMANLLELKTMIETVTLLCHCKPGEKHCHRELVAAMVYPLGWACCASHNTR